MANAKNDAPGAPSANGGSGYLQPEPSHCFPPSTPHSRSRILLSVMKLAGHDSHHAGICGTHALTTVDPVNDGRFTGLI